MELAISSALTRRLAYGVAGLMIAAAPAVAAIAGAFDGAPRVLACAETDTEDSFSMNCAPSVIPDTSDVLTEAEVAEPGWNNGFHGPAGGAPGSGGHR